MSIYWMGYGILYDYDSHRLDLKSIVSFTHKIFQFQFTSANQIKHHYTHWGHLIHIGNRHQTRHKMGYRKSANIIRDQNQCVNALFAQILGSHWIQTKLSLVFDVHWQGFRCGTCHKTRCFLVPLTGGLAWSCCAFLYYWFTERPPYSVTFSRTH